ncbi:hypothetical protein NQ317_005911 [Molorchus minor]|uniref:Uncharacterized protein n=1 Tax=Molorchus minor TaxID=1323400 RepID=A0ABQ9J4H6_9CUCU|nr:hypothetical protein NQ317_005911 [Molorchus minor]
MTEQSRAPEALTFQGNISNNWRLWKQKYELYLLASGKSSKGDDVKIAMLLNLLGDEGIQIYNTFEYEEGEDKKKLAVVLNKFGQYCNPLKNLVYEHFKFFKRDQLSSESIDQLKIIVSKMTSRKVKKS